MEEITFMLNDQDVLASEITGLYGKVGWNSMNLRTTEKTADMLQQTMFYAVARVNGLLVGFGRILGDAYTGQILDIMTDPAYRGKGIATHIMCMLLEQAKGKFLGLYLIDGTGHPTFYKQFGFVQANPNTDRLMYWNPVERN